MQQEQASEPTIPGLTPGEVTFLALLAEGYSYLNAAARLEISINTIRNRARSIYAKLRVHTKSEAVAIAIRQGLVA